MSRQTRESRERREEKREQREKRKREPGRDRDRDSQETVIDIQTEGRRIEKMEICKKENGERTYFLILHKSLQILHTISNNQKASYLSQRVPQLHHVL